MSRDAKTPNGVAVPFEALRAGIKAGREAIADGSPDRDYLTAAILATVDAMGRPAAGGPAWRLGDEGHNVDGDRDCGEAFYDSDGDIDYSCTCNGGHFGPHVASMIRGLVVAVWESDR